MTRPMRDVFAERAERFRLLDAGFQKTGWGRGDHLLEMGCAAGEAGAYVSARYGVTVTGVDCDAAAVETARSRYENESCTFVQGDAGALPFERGSFDGLYCEAAFAPLDEKEQAAAEYARVLKPGAYLLMNDFAIQFEPSEARRADVAGIPCFRGVQTMKTYGQLFQKYGLEPVYEKEDYPELIRIALRMSRLYAIEPSELGAYLTRQFGGDVGDGGTAFFSQARMTYCQMLFRKGEGRT